MILTISEKPTLWESVALVQLVQALLKEKLIDAVALPEDLDVQRLLGLAMIPQVGGILWEHVDKQPLSFSGAYRTVEQAKNPYSDVLARANGYHNLKLLPPQFPGVHPVGEPSGIVLTPFGLKADLDLMVPIWRAVVKQMRSYGEPVYLMGDDKQHRLDAASFVEGDLYLDCSLERKLQILSTAKLVIGVPNAWMWAASAWTNVRKLVLYPDNIPPKRWFPVEDTEGEHYGRLLYSAHMIQLPVILAALRKLVGDM